MTNKIILAVKSLQLVFKNPNYFILTGALAVVIALIIFLISALVLNYELLIYVFISGIFDFKTKMQIFFGILTAIRLNFSLGSIIIILVLSVLLAIDISIFIFYFKRRAVVQAEAGIGVFGLAAGFLGTGCGICGSIIMSSVFGFAAAALIAFLPFNGLEFGIIGVFFLLLSIYLIALKIPGPDICKVL